MDGASLARIWLDPDHGERRLTTDELADAFGDLFGELHRQVDALPDGPAKTRYARLANVMHGAANALHELAASDGRVRAFDGTNKPPPQP